ncbi:GDSL-type esterase/lipase family protein [Bacillus sp. FJAT-49736]|uniref:GDSL-type esterase/lipase family protein n=1 Tax=Bacillus sp. FJAT-49736 TaxID=2833582 RepID=UPI001BC9C8C8|nr:GDSL-type esterase/lipase family protein [Bacillus sp. FJAT-49736]MBS4171984.1 spore gernimation protein [Bacillus sp. FJAT-49736]
MNSSNFIYPNDLLRFCAIGDSLTLGVGSSYFVKGFITKYLWLLRRSLQVPIVPYIFGRNGATTANILRSLDHPFVKEGIIRSKVITITAGGNDLIDAAESFLRTKNEKEFFNAVDHGKKNLAAIIDTIQGMKKNGSPYIIRMMNLYDPFENIPGTDKWVEAFNQGIERLSSPPNIKVANIHDRFKGRTKELLARDHVHPNDKGYGIIADAIFELGVDPLY